MSETAAAHSSTLAHGAGPRGITSPVRWWLGALCCVLVLSGCGTFSGRSGGPGDSGKRGGYYLDDGPGDNPPANLDRIPDPVPRLEPLVRGTLKPYSVMGRSYVPMTRLAPYQERGMATWYGRRYHGQRTASGEIYDMYAMTAAHPVLPIPSYARVTHLGNGRSVIVRINDRGPFLGDRVIDLSYAAAYKLDLLRNGSALVEVEAIMPGAAPAAPATLEAEARPQSPDAPAADVQAQEASAAKADALPATASASPPSSARSSSAAPAAVSTSGAVASAAPAPAPAPAPASPVAASSAAQEVATLPASAPSDEAGGFYVQLAAFSVADNAQRFLERMRAALAAIAPTLSIVSSGSLHRVHAGPYDNRDEALQAAARIGQSLGSEPVLVPPR